MSDTAYKIGDAVIYTAANSRFQGMKGVILEIFDSPIDKYKINWEHLEAGMDGISYEWADTISLDPTVPILEVLTADMAEAIAAYLALDSVEDKTVGLWVEALEKWATGQRSE